MLANASRAARTARDVVMVEWVVENGRETGGIRQLTRAERLNAVRKRENSVNQRRWRNKCNHKWWYDRTRIIVYGVQEGGCTLSHFPHPESHRVYFYSVQHCIHCKTLKASVKQSDDSVDSRISEIIRIR